MSASGLVTWFRPCVDDDHGQRHAQFIWAARGLTLPLVEDDPNDGQKVGFLVKKRE